MALDGKLADLYDTLKWLDEQGITYAEAVDAAQERLDRLLARVRRRLGKRALYR